MGGNCLDMLLWMSRGAKTCSWATTTSSTGGRRGVGFVVRRGVGGGGGGEDILSVSQTSGFGLVFGSLKDGLRGANGGGRTARYSECATRQVRVSE